PGGLGLPPPALPTRPGRRRAAMVSGLLGRYFGEPGDDLVAERLQRLLLPVGHEGDVELVDADSRELLKLSLCRVHRPQDAEAVANLVGHELAVLRADA